MISLSSKQEQAKVDVKVAVRYLNDVIGRAVEQGLSVNVIGRTVATPNGAKATFDFEIKQQDSQN